MSKDWIPPSSENQQLPDFATQWPELAAPLPQWQGDTSHDEPIAAAHPIPATLAESDTIADTRSDPAPDLPSQGPGASRSRTGLILAIAVLLVVGGGITAGVVLNSGRGNTQSTSSPVAAAQASTIVVTATPDVVTQSVYATGPSSDDSEPSDPVASDDGSATQYETYSAPGGISVQAPAGWHADGSANLPRIRDYVPPDSPSRLAGVNFRIGIGNDQPLDSFTDEVGDAVNGLRKSLHSRSGEAGYVSEPAFGSMQGADSADIEYEFHNDAPSVDRHGIERVWWYGDHTMIISVSDVSENWPETQALFMQLVDSATLD